jgi:hypothetical protein
MAAHGTMERLVKVLIRTAHICCYIISAVLIEMDDHVRRHNTWATLPRDLPSVDLNLGISRVIVKYPGIV